MVVRANDTPATLARKVELATILGTIQSTLTDFQFLSEDWKKNTEEERLLGVSLTGIMDNAYMSGNKGYFGVGDTFGNGKLADTLNSLRDYATEVNKEWAGRLGIPESAAACVVKPSGTVSQLVDSASGIHARHSPFYIRRIRMDKKDPLCAYLLDNGYHAEDDVMKPDSTYIFSFPMKAPDGAVCRTDKTAIEQLELWLVYQRHWCHHKPSITVSVKDDEWPGVGAWVWEHFDEVSGVSFLPFSGHSYRQAPYEDMTEDQYNAMLMKMPKNIDWSMFVETDDNTEGAQTLACTAGGCEV